MRKSIKGTKTEKYLLASFAGESQARNRYTYYASAAKKEGLEQIANIFTLYSNFNCCYFCSDDFFRASNAWRKSIAEISVCFAKVCN